MLWTLILAALIVAVLVTAVAVGWKTPPTHSVTREAEFDRSMGEMWSVVADFTTLPTWMPGVRGVQNVEAVDGRERWRYDTAEGEMTIEVVRRVEPTELVIRTVNSDLGFGGTWTYRISPAERGSAVSITEDGWVTNPFFRFTTRYVFGVASTVEQALVALGRRCGENVRPRPTRSSATRDEPPRRDPVQVEPRESVTRSS